MRILDLKETSEAAASIKEGQFSFKLTIELGPELILPGIHPTREELIHILRKETAGHQGFAAAFLQHIADHMVLDTQKRLNGSEAAPLTGVIGYRACESCSPDELGNKGRVCFWEDGTSTCEYC